MVVIGMLVVYWFIMLFEWIIWVFLVVMVFYDLVVVLFFFGFFRLLVELVMFRDEDIFVLVYEVRFVNVEESGGGG